jgi:hypothetical protein
VTIQVCAWSGGDVDWGNKALVLNGPLLNALARHCRGANGYLVLAGISGLKAGDELALYEPQLVRLVSELQYAAATPLGLHEGFDEFLDVARRALSDGTDLALQPSSDDVRDQGKLVVPILWTMKAAALQLWRFRVELGQAVLIPYSLVIVLGLLGDQMALFPAQEPVLWGLQFLAESLLGSMIGVTCCRAVLWGPRAIPSIWGLSFGRRELGYFVMGLKLAAITTLPMLLLPGLLHFGGGSYGGEASTFSMLAIMIAALVVAARLLLVLPAAALDQKLSLRAGWEQTAGHGTRLAGLLILASILAYPLMLVAQVIFAGPLVMLGRLCSSVIGVLVGVYSIGLGTVVYWTLCPTRATPVFGSPD